MKLVIKVREKNHYVIFHSKHDICVSIFTGNSYIRRSTVLKHSKNNYCVTFVDKYYLVDTAKFDSFGKAQEYIQSMYDKHKDDIPRAGE